MARVRSASREGGGAQAPPVWRWVMASPLLRSRARPWRRGARGRTGRPVPLEPTEGPGDGRLQVLPGEDGIYRLVGEADIAARDRLRSALAAAVEGTGDVRLDLAALTFIDVGGTAELVGAALRLGDGRRLILDHASPMLCRIIALAWGELPGLEVNPR